MVRRVINYAEVQEWLGWVVQQETTDCLYWPFSINSKGYPKFWDGERYWQATRVVCEQTYGPAPSRHYDAAHSCGNRTCCNKRHLSWKTHSDNLEDRRGHGTLPMGANHWIARLTEEQVLAIKKSKRSQAALAQDYEVHPGTIQAIKDGRSWKHLP